MLGAMAYDVMLAERVRNQLAGTPGLTERTMFGGVGWMVSGNMAVGVLGRGLICRVEPAEYESLLNEPGADVFDYSGRPMTGWLVIDAEVLGDEEALQGWLDRGERFAANLPPKS